MMFCSSLADGPRKMTPRFGFSDLLESTTFGRRVNENDSIFSHDFWPKMTFAEKAIYEIMMFCSFLARSLARSLARRHMRPG